MVTKWRTPSDHHSLFFASSEAVDFRPQTFAHDDDHECSGPDAPIPHDDLRRQKRGPDGHDHSRRLHAPPHHAKSQHLTNRFDHHSDWLDHGPDG